MLWISKCQVFARHGVDLYTSLLPCLAIPLLNVIATGWPAFEQLSSSLAAASQSVTDAATLLRETVEATALEFQHQQEAFVASKAPAERHVAEGTEAQPPWAGMPNETELRDAIIALSADRRNVVMPPPDSAEKVFELDAVASTAEAIMQYDPRLAQLRFTLVPRQY